MKANALNKKEKKRKTLATYRSFTRVSACRLRKKRKEKKSHILKVSIRVGLAFK